MECFPEGGLDLGHSASAGGSGWTEDIKNVLKLRGGEKKRTLFLIPLDQGAVQESCVKRKIEKCQGKKEQATVTEKKRGGLTVEVRGSLLFWKRGFGEAPTVVGGEWKKQ